MRVFNLYAPNVDWWYRLILKIYHIQIISIRLDIHKVGPRLHAASFKYSEKDFMEWKVVVGINQFRDYCDYGKINNVKHVN